MANKSDEIIKKELLDVGSVGDLKIRVFPGGSREDQKHWADGGLSFGNDEVMYGSCDGAWYRAGSWKDPLSGRVSDVTPVLALEGTLALERGSSGNAQYQRFFHALGAVLSGVVGVYYLKPGKDALRYDLPQAALNVSEAHGVDYLIVSDLDEVHALLEALAEGNESKYQQVAERIKKDMAHYFTDMLDKKFGKDIEQYFVSRSIVRLPKANIKYLAGNYRNFTESSQRGGHIVLGEFLLAKYMLKEPFFFLLPRLEATDIERLDASNKKEWQVLRSDKAGKLIILDDLVGVSADLHRKILSLKNESLGGSAKGGRAKVLWNEYMKELIDGIRSGSIALRNER